jgi:hypothetical protein
LGSSKKSQNNYQICLGNYIIVKARQEAGGRRQEKNNYGIKTGFGIITQSRIELPRELTPFMSCVSLAEKKSV